MKTKRGLIKASGILYIIGAVGFFLLALGFMSLGPLFMETIDQLLAEMVTIGEIAEPDVEMIKAMVEGVFTSAPVVLGIIGLVQLIIGIKLVKHSNGSDDDILNRKGIVITALIISLLSGGLVVAILLIIALVKKAEQPVYSNSQPFNNGGTFNFNEEPKMDPNLQSIFTRPVETTTVEPSVFNNFGETTQSTVANATQQTEINNIADNSATVEYENKIKRLQQLRDSGAISQEEYITLLKQTFKD